jgi:hypothetical protein
MKTASLEYARPHTRNEPPPKLFVMRKTQTSPTHLLIRRDKLLAGISTEAFPKFTSPFQAPFHPRSNVLEPFSLHIAFVLSRMATLLSYDIC